MLHQTQGHKGEHHKCDRDSNGMLAHELLLQQLSTVPLPSLDNPGFQFGDYDTQRHGGTEKSFPRCSRRLGVS
jgi:hypothetical protein